MDSLRELLFDGWEICCSNQYEKYKNNPYSRSVPISILGEGNSGKSFLLGRIFNVEIPNGFSQKTEGISVKYLDNGEFALIDTSGLRKSINKNDKNQLKKLIQEFLISNLVRELEYKKYKNDEEEEEKIKKKIEEIKKTDINIDDIKIKNVNLFNNCLNKLKADKQKIEEFIVDFVLEKSNIILIVVGQMTINEQLFINKLKKNFDDNKIIIVIHNLNNFTKKSQVENYINDVLKKSIYFNLEECEYYDLNYEEFKKDFNKTFFIEKIEPFMPKILIEHLIFANDSKES